MTGIYYTDLLQVLLNAGCEVGENGTTDGWEHRARSSGGFANPPLGVVWHHTASNTAPANDLSYMIDGSDDAPIGNMLIDRDGVCWPIAAGAANTQGKGGPCSFSRGTAPLDSGNSTLWAIEVANSGTGSQDWPQAQVDAFFRASNALNARFGNLPTDIITHALGDGDGWTDRKVDPATADAVQGPWRPTAATSSGTWRLADIRAECAARAGVTPDPAPTPEPPDDGDDVKLYLVLDPADGMSQYVTDMATFKTRVPSPDVSGEGITLFAWQTLDGNPYGLGAGWGPFLDSLPETKP